MFPNIQQKMVVPGNQPIEDWLRVFSAQYIWLYDRFWTLTSEKHKAC